MIVGLTGSIGSGKSEAAAIFKSLGSFIIDADVLAREVVVPGSKGLEGVIDSFGIEYLHEDGTLDRKKLASLIFGDPQKRKKLESILHPLIRERFKAALKNAPKGLTIYVVPLLFESNHDYSELEKIIVVSATEANSLSRIMKRDSINDEAARERYQSQISMEEKMKRADFVIHNDGDLAELEKQVRKIYEALKDAK